MNQPAEAAVPPSPGPPTAKGREWRQFWRLDSAPQALFQALDAPELAVVPQVKARFPTLASLSTTHAAAPTMPEGVLDALAASLHRDHVATLVLDQLSELAPRVAIFSLHQGKVMGWAVRGTGVIEEDFHTLMLPLNRPSVFLNLTRGVELHVGPLVGGDGNTPLSEVFGSPSPREVVVAPITVRGKFAAFVWLDRGEGAVADIPLERVKQVCQTAGMALEILVLRQKIKASGRLTERAGAD